MKQKLVYLLLVSTSTGWAINFAPKTATWQCVVYDAAQRQWSAQSSFERTAAAKAMEACKKESSNPLSCVLDQTTCQISSVKQSKSPMLWQCTALDQEPKFWKSEWFPTREQAAIASKMLCQQKSKMSETCRVNFMTCKSIEHRE